MNHQSFLERKQPPVITIYKYQFDTKDEIRFYMPASAKPLKIHIQEGVPTMWCLVDTNNKVEPRKFKIFGTGHPITECKDYVGTYFEGPFVWHVFNS